MASASDRAMARNPVSASGTRTPPNPDESAADNPTPVRERALDPGPQRRPLPVIASVHQHDHSRPLPSPLLPRRGPRPIGRAIVYNVHGCGRHGTTDPDDDIANGGSHLVGGNDDRHPATEGRLSAPRHSAGRSLRGWREPT